MITIPLTAAHFSGDVGNDYVDPAHIVIKLPGDQGILLIGGRDITHYDSLEELAAQIEDDEPYNGIYRGAVEALRLASVPKTAVRFAHETGDTILVDPASTDRDTASMLGVASNINAYQGDDEQGRIVPL